MDHKEINKCRFVCKCLSITQCTGSWKYEHSSKLAVDSVNVLDIDNLNLNEIKKTLSPPSPIIGQQVEMAKQSSLLLHMLNLLGWPLGGCLSFFRPTSHWLQNQAMTQTWFHHIVPFCCCPLKQKSFAKVLANRLKECICFVIHPEQNSFTLGRYMYFSLHDLYHSMYIKQSKEAIVISLDAQLVLNQVEWPCMMFTLFWLGSRIWTLLHDIDWDDLFSSNCLNHCKSNFFSPFLQFIVGPVKAALSPCFLFSVIMNYWTIEL